MRIRFLPAAGLATVLLAVASLGVFGHIHVLVVEWFGPECRDVSIEFGRRVFHRSVCAGEPQRKAFWTLGEDLLHITVDSNQSSVSHQCGYIDDKFFLIVSNLSLSISSDGKPSAHLDSSDSGTERCSTGLETFN